MRFKKIIDKITSALIKKEYISLFVNCSIHYFGRAESYLDYGDRIIMLKQDNSIIIHQPIGNKPINYMKPGAHTSLTLKNKKIILNCTNTKLKERLEIIIKKVYSFQSKKLEDTEKISLKGTEMDMSDMVFKNPELIEPGFRTLSREEHIRYGFVDVFGYDKNNNLVVVECKTIKADFNAVAQLKRYVDRIKNSKGLLKVRGILAAPDITGNALLLLNEYGFTFKSINPPKKHEEIKKTQKKLSNFSR